MPYPSQRWKKKASQVEISPVKFEEDPGGHFDTGVYDPALGHPGFDWVNTDEGMAAAIQTLRTIAQER